MVTVRCHYDGKTLVPDEKVELPHDQPLVAYITPESATDESQPAADSTAPSDAGTGETESALAWIEANAIDDPLLPTDGARQHDHYLYGSPKRS